MPLLICIFTQRYQFTYIKTTNLSTLLHSTTTTDTLLKIQTLMSPVTKLTQTEIDIKSHKNSTIHFNQSETKKMEIKLINKWFAILDGGFVLQPRGQNRGLSGFPSLYSDNPVNIFMFCKSLKGNIWQMLKNDGYKNHL